MNQTLKELTNQNPKLDIQEKDLNLYKGGMILLSAFTSPDFLNIPQHTEDPNKRFDTDGLFYSVPYLHDAALGHIGNSRTLLVVWQVENGASFCPFRFEFDIQDETHYQIFLHDQRGERTVKHTFIERDGDNYYSTLGNTEAYTLATLGDALDNLSKHR